MSNILKFLAVATVAISAMLSSEIALASTPRFTPSSLNFGSVTIGQSSTVNITLDASAGVDKLRSLGLDNTLPVSALTSGNFTMLLGTCNPVPGAATGSPLSSGTGCTFSVTFTPTIAGAAVATVTTSDYTAGTWGSMALSANGVAPASVPTLNEYGLMLLASLMAMVAIWQMRKRQE